MLFVEIIELRMNFSSNNLWIIFCKKYFLIILLSRIFSIVLFLIQCSRLKIDIVRLGLTSQQLLNLSFTPKQLRLCSYLAYTRWCWSEVEAMALITALSGSGILAILLIYDLLTFRVGKLFVVFVCNIRQLLQTICPL